MWISKHYDDKYRRVDILDIPGDKHTDPQRLVVFADPHEKIWYMNYWLGNPKEDPDLEPVMYREVLAASDWDTARKKAEYAVYQYLENKQLKWKAAAWYFDEVRFGRL